MADKQGEKLLCHQTNVFVFHAYPVSFSRLLCFLKILSATVFVTLHNTHVVIISRVIVTSLFQDGTMLVQLIIFIVPKLYFIRRGKLLTFIQVDGAIQEVYCCNTGGVLL